MKNIPTVAIFLTSILAILSTSVCIPLHSMAQGNLLITPKRVVFEGNKRSEELNLANIGKDSATYLISLVQMRMDENGKFEKINQPDSGQNFAETNLRFFPRSVTLAPNEAQTIKLQFIKAGDLLPGEYRSHLYFRASPPQKPLGEEAVPEKDSALTVRLIPIFGISIPVIIRKGENTASVNFSDANFKLEKDSIPSLDMTFNRNGNMSVYGDVEVNYISSQGKATRVGMIKGLAVYTPNTKRSFHLRLDKIPGIEYHSGKLQIIYSDQSSRAIKLAEKEFALN